MYILKKCSNWLPEFYFVASVLFYWFFTSTLVNPVAICLILLLGALFKWENLILGSCLAFTMFCLSLFMILALVSELSEFPSFNTDAMTMLLGGGLWLALNIALSITMMAKWGRSA